MLVNTKEFKTVINTFKYFNSTKNLGLSDFKDLNFYIKDNYIYLITIGDFHNSHPIQMIYKFDYINQIDLNNQIYTVKPDDILNALKFCGETTNLEFKETHILIKNDEDNTQKIIVNRLLTNEYLESYILQKITLHGILNNINGVISNPLSNEVIFKIIEQIKFRNLDKQDNNSYVCFLPDEISIQQFNYTTISNINCGFTGRIPTPILKLIIQYRQIFENISVVRNGSNLEIKTDKLYISVENIDDNYHLLTGFNPTENQKINLNKKEVLQAIDFLNTFSKNNTGYFEILDNGIEFKNSTTSLDESKTVIVDKKIIQNHTIPHREVFGFDISIFKGLVGILIDDSFDLYVEQDSEDLDTFLCYILDNHNKNIMALDVYK